VLYSWQPEKWNERPRRRAARYLEQSQLFTCMQHCVFFFKTLITNVLRNTRLVSKFADRIDEKSISPEFSAPKLALHLRMLLENLFYNEAFQHRNNRCWTHLWNALNQKMNLVALLYLQTNFFQGLINSFAEYHSAIFCRTK